LSYDGKTIQLFTKVSQPCTGVMSEFLVIVAMQSSLIAEISLLTSLLTYDINEVT